MCRFVRKFTIYSYIMSKGYIDNSILFWYNIQCDNGISGAVTQ